MTDKKRILKEFEWFEVQTKVRQIISEILHPLEKKVMTISTSIDRMHQFQKQESYKTEQLIMMVNKDENIFKVGIFKDIQDRFQKQTIHIKELEHKIEHLQGYVNEKAKVLDQRLEETTQVLNGINQFKQFVKGQLDNQSHKLIESQANIFGNFTKLNQEISQLQINSDYLRSQHQIQTHKMTTLQNAVASSKKHVEQTLIGYNQRIKQIRQVQEVNNGHISHLKEQLLRVQSFEKMMRKIQNLMNEQLIRSDNLEYKIEVIQPMISFTQINEYAHHFLPQKYHKNISIYYYNKYRQLIQEILNNQFQSKRMKQSVKANIQLIKQTHKKALKLVFKLKKEQLMKRGINIDLLSHQKKQEQLANIRLEEDFSGLNVVEGEIKKEVVINPSKIIKEQIEQVIKELKEKIHIQINDSKKYIYNMDDLFKKNQENIENQIEKIIKDQSLIKIEFELADKMHKELEETLMKKMGVVMDSNNKLNKAFKQMHYIMQVFSEIEKQDEKDRLGITLLGIKQSHRDQFKDQSRRMNRSTVELDNICLSCSGNPNYYNQFFKMACLTYTSSPISLQNCKYQRIQILDKLQHQLNFLLEFINVKQSKQLFVESARKSSSESDYMISRRFGSSQIMKVPKEKEQGQVSNNYIIRNISSSQQIRGHISNSPEEPRIIAPSELTADLINKTRTRLFSRKIQITYRDSKSRKEESSKQRGKHMTHVSQYFKELKKKNESFIQN